MSWRLLHAVAQSHKGSFSNPVVRLFGKMVCISLYRRVATLAGVMAFLPTETAFANSSSFQPGLLWTRTLQGKSGKIADAGIRKGNGVVLAHNGKSLWVTTESGSVHVLSLVDTSRNSDERVYVPREIATGHDVDCRSSLALHHHHDGSVDFAIYAVLDVPPLSTTEQVNSRIIALDQNANEIWSRQLLGTVQGTPAVASDGTRIYITHNTAAHAILTVLNATAGSTITKLEDSRGWARFEYSPPTLAVDEDGEDRVYWGDANERGYASEGRIHELRSTDLTAVDSLRYFTSSTTTPPTLGPDGSLWLGGKNATVHGWSPTSAKPVWSTQLQRSLRNESFPIVNQILAVNSNRLFISSASNSFHCLDGATGNQIWKATVGPSSYLVGAKYSLQQNIVYSIQHLTGTVIQQDADTGAVNWEFGCRNFTSNPICYNSVEGEFMLDSRGTTLYYADVYGNLNALAVAESTPTALPSSIPSSSPSQVPSNMPSLAPTNFPSLVPSESPSIPPPPKPFGIAQRPINPRIAPRNEPSLAPSSSAVSTNGKHYVAIVSLAIATAL